jgi:hypothetical protein
MMQTMYGDASSRFKSLDDIFYFGGQNAHNELVVERHIASSNMEIDCIDMITLQIIRVNSYNTCNNTGMTRKEFINPLRSHEYQHYYYIRMALSYMGI